MTKRLVGWGNRSCSILIYVRMLTNKWLVCVRWVRVGSFSLLISYGHTVVSNKSSSTDPPGQPHILIRKMSPQIATSIVPSEWRPLKRHCWRAAASRWRPLALGFWRPPTSPPLNQQAGSTCLLPTKPASTSWRYFFKDTTHKLVFNTSLCNLHGLPSIITVKWSVAFSQQLITGRLTSIRTTKMKFLYQPKHPSIISQRAFKV